MDIASRIRDCTTVRNVGTLRKVMPTWLEADGPIVPIGTLCKVYSDADHGNGHPLVAEVIRVDATGTTLVPFGHTSNIVPGARVCALARDSGFAVGDSFLGHIVDSLGRPIEAGVRLGQTQRFAGVFEACSPVELDPVCRRFETGVRAIDGLLTLAYGQRVGVFAASGVGKTSLVNQLARQADVDVLVFCLVGERGREVRSLWSAELRAETRARSVIVVATSDQPAALRVRAVYQSLAMAQYWRSAGKNVLLVVDSITRLALAMRETGLAAGEPPTVRAYTPSVFAAIPRIVEICGAHASGGSISAIMTVLAETDDVDDPICELMKSLLDGHIILSRTLAERGHFPAIDILKSISRLSLNVQTSGQRACARAVIANMSRYDSARTLVESGLYVAGSDNDIDSAIAARDKIASFLTQSQDEVSGFEATVAAMNALGLGKNHVP